MTPDQIANLTPYQARMIACPERDLSDIVRMNPEEAKAFISNKKAKKVLKAFGKG